MSDPHRWLNFSTLLILSLFVLLPFCVNGGLQGERYRRRRSTGRRLKASTEGLNFSKTSAAPTGFGDPPCKDYSFGKNSAKVWENAFYVFALNAGHVGSTTLGSRDNYIFSVSEFDKGKTHNVTSAVCEVFEANHVGAGSTDSNNHPKYGGSAGKGFEEWNRDAYLKAIVADDPVCEFESTVDKLVHGYLQRLNDGTITSNKKSKCSTNLEGVRMHMDLGHHIILGLGDALVRAIAPDRLAFIRLRRNRTNTAISYYSNQKIPCGGDYKEDAGLGPGMFILCPWDHGSVLLGDDPDAYEKWESLNDFQRCLWYVDEIEARWTMFLRKYPNLDYMETKPWSTSEDLMDIMKDTASFLQARLAKTHYGLQNVSVTAQETDSKGHSHTTSEDFVDHTEDIKGYNIIMAYSKDKKELVKAQK